jgi:hypothetical protein
MKNTGYSHEQFAQMEQQISSSLEQKSLVPTGVDRDALANVLTKAAEHQRLPANAPTQALMANDGGYIVYQPSPSQDPALWPRTNSVQVSTQAPDKSAPDPDLGDMARWQPKSTIGAPKHTVPSGARNQEDGAGEMELASSRVLFKPPPGQGAPAPGTVGPGGATRHHEGPPEGADQIARVLFKPPPGQGAPAPGTVGPGGATRHHESGPQNSELIASSNGVLFTPDPKNPFPTRGVEGGSGRMTDDSSRTTELAAAVEPLAASKPRVM